MKQWERSGRSAAEFAEPRGLSPRTLTWWKWRLKRDSNAGGTTHGIRLVPVRVEAAPSLDRVEDREAEELAWEIEAPSGHVLRVVERGAARGLVEALAIIERGGRRR